MSNQSYCRWRNTRNDLDDCADHLCEELDKEEAQARRQLLRKAAYMLRDLGIEIDTEELELSLKGLPEEK